MAPIHLGPRSRLAAKIAGFVVLGLVSFMFALQLTFPYERVRDKVIEELSSSYIVKVGEVSRGIMPGKFTFKKVWLTARPAKADDVPETMYFEEIEGDVGAFALLRGVGAVDFTARMRGGGTIEGALEATKTSFMISASAHALPAIEIPQIQPLIGLPMMGKLDASLSFSLPKGDWRQAAGELTITCKSGCAIGDGHTKWRRKLSSQRNAVMMGDGIEFGKVDVDKLVGRIDIKKGKLELTKWEFDSKDAELHVELGLKLGKKFKDLELEVGCFRFKPSDSLQQREARTATAITTLGGVRGPDGLFHIKLDGRRYSEIKARGRVCGAGTSGEDDVAGGGHVGRTPALGAVQQADMTRPPEPPVPDVMPTVFDAAPPPPDATGTGSAGAGSGTGAASGGFAPGLRPGGPAGAGPTPAEIKGEPPPPPPPPPPTTEPPPEVPPAAAPHENE